MRCAARVRQGVSSLSNLGHTGSPSLSSSSQSCMGFEVGHGCTSPFKRESALSERVYFRLGLGRHRKDLSFFVKKQEFMQELFSEEGKIKNIITEQGHVEAFEHLEFTDKIQCIHCHRYMTSAFADVFLFMRTRTCSAVQQQFELLAAAFLMIKGVKQRENTWTLG